MAENIVLNYSNIELARAEQIKREGKSSMVFTSSFKKKPRGQDKKARGLRVNN